MQPQERRPIYSMQIICAYQFGLLGHASICECVLRNERWADGSEKFDRHPMSIAIPFAPLALVEDHQDFYAPFQGIHKRFGNGSRRERKCLDKDGLLCLRQFTNNRFSAFPTWREVDISGICLCRL
jgi:hypothetical protein